LPFSQENRTPEGGAFSLGLTAAVTEELATWSDYQRRLYVVPATEVIDTGVDTPVLLHQTLGVNLIITGRLEVVNQRTRITVVLNEISRDRMAVKDKRTLEIGPDDREPPESKVAAAIAQLLKVSPPRAAPRSLEGGSRLVEAETSYLVGRGYLLQGPDSLTSAITAFLDAIQKNERLAVAYAGASEAYLNSYDATRDAESLKDAQIKIDEAIALDPLDPRSHVIRGRVYLTTSQHGRAIVEFKRAIDIDPNVSDAQNYLATAYEADGAMEMAENEYRKVIALHPRYWSGYEDLGIFLYKHGRYHDAEQNFVVGSGYAPANRRAFANLAAVYEIQERFTAAEAELVKGLKLSPDTLLYNNLGWIYIQEGKFEDAVNAMTEAVKLPRANSVVWSGLARAYRWSGRHGEDERLAYKTALERADEEVRTNPLNADTRANRAYLLAETHHEREALGEISATLGIENARGNVTVLFRSALIHELAGDRKGALEALGQAARGGYPRSRIERDPDLKNLRNDPGYRQVLDVAGRASN
jgi:Flp pilus assembly protein TadD